MSPFGRRLAAIRADRGLTQRELARAIGKSRQAICHWEGGRAADIRAGDLRNVARALGCRMRDVLAPPEAPMPPRPPWWPRRRASKRRGRPARAAPTSSEAAEVERLRALLLEVLQRLVRYEPEAVDLLDRVTPPSESAATARAALISGS